MGMFVRGFEGKWLSHPFWKNHFLISSEEKLARVRTGQIAVIIDTSRGLDVAVPQGESAATKQMATKGRFGRADTTRAAELAQRCTGVVKTLFDDCRLGRTIDTAAILLMVDEISGELVHNMPAFLAVTRLKAKDEATYTHSVAVCALMISLAREMGVPPYEVRELGMAGLLHDIGKAIVSDDILHKPTPLTREEWAQIKRHPTFGYEMLSRTPGLPPVALDVCLHHHERLDGTGYPSSLIEADISRAVRMASVCDVYDAMTSIRSYKKGMSPLEAITAMDAVDGHFDRTILFRFMRNIGVYPAGKLVRLGGNRLAITLPPHPNGLGCVFRAFYSTTDTRFTRYEDIILAEHVSCDDAVAAEDPITWFHADWSTIGAAIMAGRRVDCNALFTRNLPPEIATAS
ncbi:HD-GYP domain-containing protein [Sphingomonas sp. PP-CE-1G-424]|uniref:HD-GYP domain-containing protein n=1 Tax=Sphingomonas sp. PP-CE-1G-424 TaxID=2135658 RepID=UPI0014056086|nr:HD-GYP domain-containing protein [Sphingomonas sp. PP-CE-1G-424]